MGDLELMKADGETIYCSRQSNPEIFKAALLSLGCIGIVISVTLQCEPAFRLHETAESVPVEEVSLALSLFPLIFYPSCFPFIN